MNTLKKNLLVLAFALAFSIAAFGQAVTPSTTFSTAVGYGDQYVNLTATSVTTSSGTYTMSSWVQNAYTTVLMVDRELIGITILNGKVAAVARGVDGTVISGHSTIAPVWFGPPAWFSQNVHEPSGTCTSTNEMTLPRFFEMFGTGWTCPATGPNTGQWELQYAAPVSYLAADSSLTGTVGASICHAQYSFAVDGGAVGLITPANNCTIPKNAIVYQGIVEVGGTMVGSSGNVSVGISAGAGGAAALLAATARASLTTGLMFQSPPVPTTASASNTSFFKMSAAGTVTVTVATNALTAGILDVYVWYVVPTV